MPIRRAILSLLPLLLALLILAAAVRLAVRSEPRDGLRQADAAMIAGRYYQALQDYGMLARQAPHFAPAQARLGMLHALRGERQAATQALARSLSGNLSAADVDLVRLYQGVTAIEEGNDPRQFWALIGPHAPLYGISRVLEGEYLTSNGEYAGAEAALRAALTAQLPRAWRQVAHTSLALLRASSDPATAQRELSAAITGTPETAPTGAALAAALLPRQHGLAERLTLVLEQAPPARALLLGQLYLERGLYPLAEVQFKAIAPGSREALPAAAYAAYTRWQAGDHAGGLEQLRTLAAAYPDEPRARSLLALASLGSASAEETRQELTLISALAPGDPAVQLAWGQWYVAQRDYVAAAAAFTRARALAPLEERGLYAAYLARFRLATGLQVCEQGLPVAEEAARLQSRAAQAWLTLAQVRSACDDRNGALVAAQQAVTLAPADAEALYRLGRALAATGASQAARAQFVRAADAEPASLWRARAEDALALLPPY